MKLAARERLYEIASMTFETERLTLSSGSVYQQVALFVKLR